MIQVFHQEVKKKRHLREKVRSASSAQASLLWPPNDTFVKSYWIVPFKLHISLYVCNDLIQTLLKIKEQCLAHVGSQSVLNKTMIQPKISCPIAFCEVNRKTFLVMWERRKMLRGRPSLWKQYSEAYLCCLRDESKLRIQSWAPYSLYSLIPGNSAMIATGYARSYV